MAPFLPRTDEGRCPCQSGASYGECCGPLHAGIRNAPTAVQLMRSRYSAFVVGAADYLLQTWHPSTRPAALKLDPEVRWFGLEILQTTGGGPLDSTGTVEFRARYKVNGGVGEQHEHSTFRHDRGRWYYLAAIAPA
ncbi:MAG: YchJ family protein [Microbacteriaceae bacterium]